MFTFLMKKFWCGSCSCRVPVVLGGFVSRLGYPRPPVFDGAGVPWVLTKTDQRDAPSRHDDGDIRVPTPCGWHCHGRHGRDGRESSRYTRYPPTLFFPQISNQIADVSCHFKHIVFQASQDIPRRITNPCISVTWNTPDCLPFGESCWLLCLVAALLHRQERLHMRHGHMALTVNFGCTGQNCVNICYHLSGSHSMPHSVVPCTHELPWSRMSSHEAVL